MGAFEALLGGVMLLGGAISEAAKPTYPCIDDWDKYVQDCKTLDRKEIDRRRLAGYYNK